MQKIDPKLVFALLRKIFRGNSKSFVFKFGISRGTAQGTIGHRQTDRQTDRQAGRQAGVADIKKAEML